MELLDIVNNRLVEQGQETIAFDHDCREGICGACGLYINGRPHGPDDEITTCPVVYAPFCQRQYHNGGTVAQCGIPCYQRLDGWKEKRLTKSCKPGGFVSVNTGAAPEAHNILIPHAKVEESMDAAACVGCGACVATCKNRSAMLFVAARVSSLALLPPRQTGSRPTRQSHGQGNGSSGFWILHEYRRLSGRMPQRHHSGPHCPLEPRIFVS